MTRATDPRRKRPLLDLEAFLPYRVAVLAQRLSRHVEEAARRAHRLPVKDWTVMQIMAAHGPLLPADIGRIGTQDKATISRAIKCLLDRGLVSKQPKPGDGRTFAVALTAEGWAVYEAIVPQVRRRQQEALAALGAGEADELQRLVAKLDDALRDARKRRKAAPRSRGTS